MAGTGPWRRSFQTFNKKSGGPLFMAIVFLTHIENVNYIFRLGHIINAIRLRWRGILRNGGLKNCFICLLQVRSHQTALQYFHDTNLKSGSHYILTVGNHERSYYVSSIVAVPKRWVAPGIYSGRSTFKK